MLQITRVVLAGHLVTSHNEKHLGSLGWFSLGIKLPCYGDYLEDHPSGCKWLITMGDRFCPLNGVVGPLTNGLFMAYKWR